MDAINTPLTVSSRSKRKSICSSYLPEQGRTLGSCVRKLQKPKKHWTSRWESTLVPTFEAVQNRISQNWKMEDTQEITKLSQSGRKKRMNKSSVAECHASSTGIYNSGCPSSNMNLPISESFVEEVADFSDLHLLADTAIQDDLMRSEGNRGKRIKDDSVAESHIFSTETSESGIPRRNTKVLMNDSFVEDANTTALHELAQTVIHLDNEMKRTKAGKRGKRINPTETAIQDDTKKRTKGNPGKRIKHDSVTETQIFLLKSSEPGNPRTNIQVPTSDSFEVEANMSALHQLAQTVIHLGNERKRTCAGKRGKAINSTETAIQDDMKKRTKGNRRKRIKHESAAETQIFLPKGSEPGSPRTNIQVPISDSLEVEANRSALHQLLQTVAHLNNETKRTSAAKRGKGINRDSVAENDVDGICNSECRVENMRATELSMEESNSIPVHIEHKIHTVPVVHQFLGINFYKRIGRWTAHIWAEKKQHYLGSYSTATEAARAYDKASLKHFGDCAKLNFQRNEYLHDIDKMNKMAAERYRNILKRCSRMSKAVEIIDGISKCPEGWFEVKFREQAPPKMWKFLGRFDNLEDAKRLQCFPEFDANCRTRWQFLGHLTKRKWKEVPAFDILDKPEFVKKFQTQRELDSTLKFKNGSCCKVQ